jgi:hypothetical protein
MRMIQMLNDTRNGYFHEFYHDQDRSYGVIEFLDGKIEVINIKEFKFKEPPYPEMPPMPNWPIYPAVSKS